MKIYNTIIHDNEAGKEIPANIAVLETEDEKKAYDAENYDKLFEKSGYEDEDIFYFVRADEIPEQNNGHIVAGDDYDFIHIVTVNRLEYQSH